jgi:hypothetical protein
MTVSERELRARLEELQVEAPPAEQDPELAELDEQLKRSEQALEVERWMEPGDEQLPIPPIDEAVAQGVSLVAGLGLVVVMIFVLPHRWLGGAAWLVAGVAAIAGLVERRRRQRAPPDPLASLRATVETLEAKHRGIERRERWAKRGLPRVNVPVLAGLLLLLSTAQLLHSTGVGGFGSISIALLAWLVWAWP